MYIVKFSSTWCPPCKLLKPIFEKISKKDEYKDKIFIEVDVEGSDKVEELDAYPNDLSIRYMIRNVPTILFLNDKKEEIKRIVGFKDENSLENEIKNAGD